MQKLKIGYFEHWFRPPYTFAEFLGEQGIEVQKIDYSYPGYLEGFDVVLIEQNGFNDYIENDELYIQDWVARGGILLFMHQDYQRWAPYFLPEGVGYTQLIHRHVLTINGFDCAADPTFTQDNTPYKSYMWYMSSADSMAARAPLCRKPPSNAAIMANVARNAV